MINWDDKSIKKLQAQIIKNAKKAEKNNWSTEGRIPVVTLNRKLLARKLAGEDVKDIDIYTRREGAGYKQERIDVDNKFFIEVDVYGSGMNVNNVYIKRMEKYEKRGRKVRDEKAYDRVKLAYNLVEERYNITPQESLHEAIVKFKAKLR